MSSAASKFFSVGDSIFDLYPAPIIHFGEIWIINHSREYMPPVSGPQFQLDNFSGVIDTKLLRCEQFKLRYTGMTNDFRMSVDKLCQTILAVRGVFWFLKATVNGVFWW